jgi:hypothetical protein
MGRGWPRGLPLIFRFSRTTGWGPVVSPVNLASRRGTLILVNSQPSGWESVRYLFQKDFFPGPSWYYPSM